MSKILKDTTMHTRFGLSFLAVRAKVLLLSVLLSPAIESRSNAQKEHQKNIGILLVLHKTHFVHICKTSTNKCHSKRTAGPFRIGLKFFRDSIQTASHNTRDALLPADGPHAAEKAIFFVILLFGVGVALTPHHETHTVLRTPCCRRLCCQSSRKGEKGQREKGETEKGKAESSGRVEESDPTNEFRSALLPAAGPP